MAGEVLNTYIIVEQGDKVLFIDKPPPSPKFSRQPSTPGPGEERRMARITIREEDPATLTNSFRR